MPKIAKVESAKSAKAPPRRARSTRPKNGGARILTREEVMASLPPLKPGQRSAHDWMREQFRPLREFNLWLIKNGHPEGLGELDMSLQDEDKDAAR